MQTLRSGDDFAQVDIVLPHVDGRAPGYEALCRHHTGDFVPCQIRDLGELRFVLRSISRYAPRANVVLIVQSEGHVPDWLNRDCVRVVAHDAFIPHDLLPTFHWATIAANIFRIPGLSEKFVYWEDDVLAGAPLSPADLFAPDDLPVPTWAAIPIPLGLGALLGQYQRNLEETRRALSRLIGTSAAAFLYPHAPLPATRSSWARFFDDAMRDTAFERTVTRRSRGDERSTPTVDPTVLYANWIEVVLRGKGNGLRYVQALSRAIRVAVPAMPGASAARWVCAKYPVVNDPSRMRANMERLQRAAAAAALRGLPTFFNVNDEAYDPWDHGDRANAGLAERDDPWAPNPVSTRLLLATLVALFPERCRYERDAAGAGQTG